MSEVSELTFCIGPIFLSNSALALGFLNVVSHDWSSFGPADAFDEIYLFEGGS
jgi:hypothetical protein